MLVVLLMLASFNAGVEYQRGDVSHDGKVNISDVTFLIYYLLNGSWPESGNPEDAYTKVYTANGVSFKMIDVEGGSFTMGATSEQSSDAYSDEKPTHRVNLSGYSIGQTEVTQALWNAVMGTNPSNFPGDLNRPVERVSWNECQAFITKLNTITGKTFRLPTEAEWEFAARGGTKTQTNKYAGSNTISEVAWYDANYNNPYYGTKTVAIKERNELGLYDMSGNVGEWCQDWYGSYSSSSQTNPKGPSNGSARVIRGGGWNSFARDCRVSFRDSRGVTETNYAVGLRLAM